MKRTTVIFALALLALIAASCANPSAGKDASDSDSSGCSLHVTTGGSGRSVLPDSMQPETYHLIATAPSGGTVEKDSTDGSFSLVGIEAGLWSLTVQGLDSSGYEFLEGSATATIEENGTTNVMVRLSVYACPSPGGIADLLVSWPADKTPDALVGTLTRIGPSSIAPAYTLEMPLDGLSSAADWNYTNLESGSYILTLYLAKAGVKMSRIITDTVVLYNGKTSSGAYVLDAADFGSGKVVTYNAYGGYPGGPPVDGNYYESGDTATALAPDASMSMSGYSFAGWNTQPGGAGVTYNPGDSISIGADDVILYAMWTPLPTYTITYYKNDATSGTAPAADPSHYSGEIVRIANSSTLKKTLCAFRGWNTTSDGTGNWYQAEKDYPMPDGNLELYAIFSTGFAFPAIDVPSAGQCEITGLANVRVGKTYSYYCGNALGTAPLSCQWYLDGLPIAGKTTNSLSSYAFVATGFHTLSCMQKYPSNAVYSASLTVQVLE